MTRFARMLYYFSGFGNAFCGNLGNLGKGLRATIRGGDRPEKE